MEQESKTKEAVPVGETFRVNYYLGALLAQGGNFWIKESAVVFSPTSALDRAMGAKDLEIPFQKIRNMNYSSALSRSFTLRTDDKVHKFEGNQAKKIWELLEKVLPSQGGSPAAPQNKGGAIPPTETSGLTCDKCVQSVQPGYSFCPHCAARVKTVCSSCHRSIDPRWAACAFCGWKFTKGPSSK